MKFQKLLAMCFAALAFAACGEKEDIPDVNPQTEPSTEVSAFFATVKYTFNGLSSKDAAYGDFLILYCEAGGQGASAFEAWKNGNDKPGCEIFRKGSASTSGSYEGRIDNLKPDTEYDYVVCFKSEDGENRQMSKPSVFRTSAFKPVFSDSQFSNVSYQKADIKTKLGSIEKDDMKYCVTGLLISNENTLTIGKSGVTALYLDPNSDGQMKTVYTNFMPNTQYFCRPFVSIRNTDIVVYGEEFSMTTKNFDEKKVDLGLPSGICWAECNLDAESFDQFGGYYWWAYTTPNMPSGQVSEAWYYDNDSGPEIVNGGDIAGSEYDAAHVRLGGKWRMPKLEELEELFEYCQVFEDDMAGNMYVMRFYGPNGANIMIPYSGYLAESGGRCEYWEDGKAWAEWESKGKKGETDYLLIYITTSTQYYEDGEYYASRHAYEIEYENWKNKVYQGPYMNGIKHPHHGFKYATGSTSLPIRPVWDPNM